MTQASAIRKNVSIPLSLESGAMVSADFITFSDLEEGKEHVALAFHAGRQGKVPLVRLHSECLTGDVFGSRRCDCGPQLNEAIEYMARHGGIILYLRQEGRGIGLYNKIDAYALQDEKKLDTFDANVALGHGMDERSYLVAAQMLKAMNIETVRLLSNNPDKARQLEGHGIKVTEQVPTRVYLNNHNEPYLKAKERAGHKIILND